VPVEVRRSPQALAMRWIIDGGARAQREDDDGAALGRAARRVEWPGAAVKKREDVHRMAEANRAFSHYRW
jgi:small subunit ribosomal protein S7